MKVHQHEPPVISPGHQPTPHPPVVVQSVYVGRNEDDEKEKREGNEKSKSRKKGRHEDPSWNDDEEDPNNNRNSPIARRARRRNRPQRRNVLRSPEPMDYYSYLPYEDPIIIGGPMRGDCCSDYCGGCGGCGCYPSRVIYID